MEIQIPGNFSFWRLPFAIIVAIWGLHNQVSHVLGNCTQGISTCSLTRRPDPPRTSQLSCCSRRLTRSRTMLLTPLLLVLPSLLMAMSFLSIPPVPLNSTFSFRTPLPAGLLYDRISMEIGQVYQAVPPPANLIVHLERRATFHGPGASRAPKTLNSLNLVRKVKRVSSKAEKWEAAPMIEERSWDKKRMTGRLGKRGSQLKKLVFILSTVQRRKPVVKVSQNQKLIDLLAALATQHWKTKKQMLKQKSPFIATAFNKFARVVWRWLTRHLCKQKSMDNQSELKKNYVTQKKIPQTLLFCHQSSPSIN